MTETPVDPGPDDLLPEAPDRLHEALVQFTTCIGNAVMDVCSFGLTMGDAYVPFDPDPDEDCDDDVVDGMLCSQLWVRVMGVNPKDVGDVGFGGQDCSLTLTMDLEVGVLRCIEIPEDGEAPNTTQVLTGALQSMSDMNDILCAALSCGATEEDPEARVFDEIIVGSWAPLGPLGGQAGGVWHFTVEI